MILVTVGSSPFPFDRLLRGVDGVTRDEELVVQHGSSHVRPGGARCVEFVPFDALAALMREARLVVTHAGVGSILLALTSGRKPVVVPRRRSFGEAVDDHQLECARRFGRDGLVTLLEEPGGLGALVSSIGEEPLPERSREDVPLVLELRQYIREAIGPRQAA